MARLPRLLLIVILMTYQSAGAQTPILQAASVLRTIRTENHRGYGRVLYEFTVPVLFELTTKARQAELSVPDVVAMPPPSRLPRNVSGVSQTGAGLTFTLAPGARARAMRDGDRIMVDFLDPRPRVKLAASEPPSAIATSRPPQSNVGPNQSVHGDANQGSSTPSGTGAFPTAVSDSRPVPAPPREIPDAAAPHGTTASIAPAPAPATPSSAGHTHSGSSRAVAAAATPVSSEPLHSTVPTETAASSPPPAADNGPISIAATPLADGVPGATLPFATNVGAAAFQRGSRAILVFDARQPLDLSQLRASPTLGTAVVNLLPQATLVSFDLPRGNRVQLDKVAEGWRVQVGPGGEGTPVTIQQHADRVVFGLFHPSHVVVVPDPLSGAPLLVGTIRPKAGAGAAMSVPRQTPAYKILPAWLGVVVEAASDGLQLRARSNSFVLHVPPALLAHLPASTAALASAAALTRVFDFPDLSTSALFRRMRGEVASAAMSPPRARFLPRVAAAQAMMALGLDAEAYGVLEVARADDPRSAGRSNAAALQSVAALLNGDLGQDERMPTALSPTSDEGAFWRAIADAARDERAPASAAVFAVTMPLVASYPAAVRSKLLPLIAETLVRGGQGAAADALFDGFPNDRALRLAHAMRLQQKGDTTQALAEYEALAAGKDRLVRVRAAVRAVRLRHHLGQLDAAATADGLDRLIVAWRGGKRELALRLRIARLRTEAGQFRAALQMLRESQALFPDSAPAIRLQTGNVFTALLAGDRAKAVKPLELVAIAEDFASSVPDGPAGDHLAELLADRLVKLDLPDQAAPVFDRLMRNAVAGAPRARFGAQLARVQLEGGDATAALAALQFSEAPDLPPALAEERTLVLARAEAKLGKLSDAVAALSGVGTARADDLRASLLEGAKDWPGALAALRDLASKRVPLTGMLAPDQQEIVLREASAALQAGDQQALAALRDADGVRMSAGPRAALFQLLTGRPVQVAADLPRGARTVSLAREMPQQLQALAAP